MANDPIEPLSNDPVPDVRELRRVVAQFFLELNYDPREAYIRASEEVRRYRDKELENDDEGRF